MTQSERKKILQEIFTIANAIKEMERILMSSKMVISNHVKRDADKHMKDNKVNVDDAWDLRDYFGRG